MIVDATFKHSQGYLFKRVYKSKRGFSIGVSTGKHCTFVDAVVIPGCIIVRPGNLQSFLKGK